MPCRLLEDAAQRVETDGALRQQQRGVRVCPRAGDIAPGGYRCGCAVSAVGVAVGAVGVDAHPLADVAGGAQLCLCVCRPRVRARCAGRCVAAPLERRRRAAAVLQHRPAACEAQANSQEI